jgi:hypothetical protein
MKEPVMAEHRPSEPDATSDNEQTATADRRGPDRRQNVVDQRPEGSFERRRGPGRRRSDFVKSADEGELTNEQFLFVKAIDAYKRANQRPYPTWTEVLEVIRKLGYRKTTPMAVELPAAQDWTEPADAPAFAPQAKKRDVEQGQPLDDADTEAVTEDWLDADAD